MRVSFKIYVMKVKTLDIVTTCKLKIIWRMTVCVQLIGIDISTLMHAGDTPSSNLRKITSRELMNVSFDTYVYLF